MTFGSFSKGSLHERQHNFLRTLLSCRVHQLFDVAR